MSGAFATLRILLYLSVCVRLWGFDGTTANTRVIKSVDELKQLIEAKTALAGYVYIYTCFVYTCFVYTRLAATTKRVHFCASFLC